MATMNGQSGPTWHDIETRERLSDLERDLATAEARLDKHEDRLDDHEARLDTQDERPRWTWSDLQPAFIGLAVLALALAGKLPIEQAMSVLLGQR